MKFVHKLGFGLLGGIFALVALMCLGALAEDNAWIANILNYILHDDTVTIIFAYIALQASYSILFKVGLASSWLALLLWNEIIAAGTLRSIFHFTKEEVLFHHRRSFDYEIRKIFPIINTHIAPEAKVRFSLNIVSLIIAFVEAVKMVGIYGVNSLFLLLQKNNKSELNTNYIGFDVFRFFKGIVVLICELLVIPLKLIEPLADAPYWFMYFFLVFLPDVMIKIFTNNRHVQSPNNENSNPNSASHIEQGQIPIKVKNNIGYINKKLEESLFESDF